jgi:hypothetical protein
MIKMAPDLAHQEAFHHQHQRYQHPRRQVSNYYRKNQGEREFCDEKRGSAVLCSFLPSVFLVCCIW